MSQDSVDPPLEETGGASLEFLTKKARRERFVRECAKLDAAIEMRLAEEWIVGDVMREDWSSIW